MSAWPPLVLGSSSPRRAAILSELGLSFRTVVPEVDEQAEGCALERVREIAARKAHGVAAKVGPQSLVIACDTLVAVQGRVLGKPWDRAQAEEMLWALSGREHQVHSAVVLSWRHAYLTGTETTDVRFATLRPQWVAAYVAGSEPLDKAGAYAIQGRAQLFVQGISGSYTNVVGFPVECFGRLLEEWGLDLVDRRLRQSPG